MKRLICLTLGFTLIAACSNDYSKKKLTGSRSNANPPAASNPPPVDTNTPPDGNNTTPPNTSVATEKPFTKAPRPKSDRITDDFIPFFDDADVVLQDIGRVQRDDPDDVRFTRYLSLSFLNYIETPSEDDFFKMKSDLIDSMAVLLNNLSTQQAIAKPVPVDDAWTIFRIDLRNYGWSAQQWDDVVAGRNGNNKQTYPYQNNFNQTETDIARKLSTRAGIVRADWFMTEATKPATYYRLLKSDSNLNTFDRNLNTDRIADLQRTIDDPEAATRVMRVGIGAGGSKKSISNRMLERHKGKDGFVWMSYDFARQNGDNRRNIFVSPIGPNPDIKDIKGRGNQQITAFRADNHSIIYSLPNGLTGFALYDGNRNLIEAASPNVIFDPNNRDDQGVIEAGVSCLSCHGNGLKGAKDEMRDNMKRQAAADLFTDDVVKTTLSLHPEQAVIDSQIKKDNETIVSAIKDARLLAKTGDGAITQILKYYEKDMTLDMVASELNLTTEQFNKAAPFFSEDLQLKLQPLASNQLDRVTFETLFPQLVQELFDLEQKRL